MSRSRILWIIAIWAPLLLAVLFLLLSRLEYAPVKAWVDARSADGDVETYDAAFHAGVRHRLRLFALVLLAAGAAAWAMGRVLRRQLAPPAGQWSSFMADLGTALREKVKKTSAAHKRVVLLLILIGTVLRGWLLHAPITYDEAFTYTYFSSKPLGIILADYAYPNNHVLHTLLVKASTALFGIGLVQLRLPAFLAGVLVLPLFYLFVRSVFNRYIALLALALAAGSAGLVEYSTLARGYSLTWLFWMCALLLGRHFTRTNNVVSAVLMGGVLALGMWTIPTMLQLALMVFVWILITLAARYESSLRDRQLRLVLAGVVFIIATALLYMPVLVVHGVGQLLHHSTMGDNSWVTFVRTHQDRVFELWHYFSQEANVAMTFVGMAGLFFSVYITTKYRTLVAATLVACVPLTLAQSLVAPPRVWLWTLFILHLGSAIALFYLLKLLQDRVYAGFNKRMRTTVSAFILVLFFGWQALQVSSTRVRRYTDARPAAAKLAGLAGSRDRVLIEFPWEAPMEFELLARGVDRDVLYRDPAPDGTLYVVVSPAEGQSAESVLEHHRMGHLQPGTVERIQDLRQLEIFAAHLRSAPSGGASAGDAR
ncbi:MAG: glycosyltransferase family 39 protein [Flavobacteriales bacterium]|nr:glycosyltransferase family 39 protein [Flavobacteriales bacterium]